MKNTDITKATILIERDTWKLFRDLCKANETDASKEVRKFIKQYIAENSDKIKDIVLKSNNKEEKDDWETKRINKYWNS